MFRVPVLAILFRDAAHKGPSKCDRWTDSTKVHTAELGIPVTAADARNAASCFIGGEQNVSLAELEEAAK